MAGFACPVSTVTFGCGRPWGTSITSRTVGTIPPRNFVAAKPDREWQGLVHVPELIIQASSQPRGWPTQKEGGPSKTRRSLPDALDKLGRDLDSEPFQRLECTSLAGMSPISTPQFQRYRYFQHPRARVDHRRELEARVLTSTLLRTTRSSRGMSAQQSVEPTGDVNLLDYAEEFLSSLLGQAVGPAGPGVVSTGRDFESVAHPGNRPLLRVIDDEREGQLGGLAK